MKKDTRKNGFLLPLALLSLLVISVLAINGFSYIQNSTVLLTQHAESIEIEKQKKLFEKLAFKNNITQNPRISATSVSLSGLYNLSFLTDRDANDQTNINIEQLEVLHRLLSKCTGAPDIAIPIAEYLITSPLLESGFGLLDLLNELSVPLDTGVELLPCIRIASGSHKLNLSLASEITLQAYFDLSPKDAGRLAKYIDNQKIPNHESLKAFLTGIHQDKNFSAILRSTIISDQLDHRATVLEYSGETFAYLDSVLDSEGNWIRNRNFFLWIPMK